MKKLILLVLLVVAVSFATDPKFFLPVLIESSNGRPIKNQNLDLYDAGTATKATDCTWLDGGRYYYTDTTAVPPGLYDIYLNDNIFITNIYIGVPTISGLADAWNSDITDSLVYFSENRLNDSLTLVESYARAQINDSLDIFRSGANFNGIVTFTGGGYGYARFFYEPHFWLAGTGYIPFAEYMNVQMQDEMDTLRADISDSLTLVTSWWDVAWANVILADSTGDEGVELWNTNVHRIRIGTASLDTVMSMPFYMKEDMDSIAIVFRYKTENSSNGATIIFNNTSSQADTGIYAASTATLTKRLCIGTTGMGANAVYSLMLTVLPASSATDIYIWPVIINMLRNKR